MKRERGRAVYETTSLATKSGVTYPVDVVRDLYINSDKSIEELAVQLQLPTELVKHHAEQGLASWNQLKQEKLANRLKYFMDLNIDNLTETHSILEDGHFLMIVQIKGMQDILKAYYAKMGHLFRIDHDGQISLDGYGLPIPMPLPNGPKQFMALEAFLKLKEGTKQALNQVYEASKQNDQKPEVVDLEQYNDIFAIDTEKK